MDATYNGIESVIGLSNEMNKIKPEHFTWSSRIIFVHVTLKSVKD